MPGCNDEPGHHPEHGPFTVHDEVLGASVPFEVYAQYGAGYANFPWDASASCVGSCSVTFPPGSDGLYYVHVGNPVFPPADLGIQGHIAS